MQVYQADPNGYYIGPVMADPDPLDKGNWLIPGGAITVRPPALAEGERAKWEGSAWQIIAAPAEAEPEPVQPEPTPEELRAAMPPITRRQLRLTLVRNGISLADVEAAIEAMPDGLAKTEARIEWEDAREYERLHPTLVLIGDALGMTPEQVDALWEQAVEA